MTRSLWQGGGEKSGESSETLEAISPGQDIGKGDTRALMLAEISSSYGLYASCREREVMPKHAAVMYWHENAGHRLHFEAWFSLGLMGLLLWD